jgi:hypothetical protein
MSILKFLDEATKADTLLRIRREVEGEDDDEEEDAEEVEDDVERRVRQPSKLMLHLLAKHGAKVEGASDWTNFLRFLGEHIAEIADLRGEALDKRLHQLQELTLHAQRILSKSLRNCFSQVINVAKEYLTKAVSADQFSELMEGHWRKIVRVSPDVLKVQLKMKEDALMERITHQYEIDFDTYSSALIKLSAAALKPVDDLSKADVVGLLCCVEGNVACRKSEILDPTITFVPFSKYRQELGRSGLPVSTTFTLGDEKEGISMDEGRALAQFKEQNILVQKGRFKDRAQRNMQYGDDSAARLQETNAILRRPCLLFSAEDTAKMVHTIRRYFKITLGNRPTGPNARREIGEMYVTSRDIRTYVLEKYFPQILSHARKFHFPIGSHFFRSAAANFLADAYQGPVRRATGSAVHRQVLMKTFLTHGGSLQSAMSYANVSTQMPMSVEELQTPLMHLYKTMKSQIDDLVKTVATLTERMNTFQPVQQASDMLEFTVKGEKKYVKKRNDIGTPFKDAADRDDRIRKAITALEEAGVPVTHDALKRMGFGSETYKDFREGNALNYTASQRKCKKAPAAAAAAPAPRPPPAAPARPPQPADRNLRERQTHVDLSSQLPYGDKVILTKPNSTANAKRQQLKRGRETFSGPENAGMTLDSDADCAGRIVQKTVKTDKGRDLPVRVCEEVR